MKAQWQLIDIETRETVATLGYPFDLDGGEAVEKELNLLKYDSHDGIITLVGILNAAKTYRDRKGAVK